MEYYESEKEYKEYLEKIIKKNDKEKQLAKKLIKKLLDKHSYSWKDDGIKVLIFN